jgi:hypothetical protein
MILQKRTLQRVMEECHSHKEMRRKPGNNYTWFPDNTKTVSSKGSCDMDPYNVTSISIKYMCLLVYLPFNETQLRSCEPKGIMIV